MKQWERYIILCAVLLAICSLGRQLRVKPVRPVEDLCCYVPSSALEVALVQKFCEDHTLGSKLVQPLDSIPSPLDSLIGGQADLLVFREAPDSLPGGLASSIPFPNGTVWVLRKTESHALLMINRWIASLSSEQQFKRMQRDFHKGKSVNLEGISQYDSAVKRCAATLGWDWRLLSAIIYNESRFHHEANSSKGAVGLMQIRSRKYTVDTLLIPSVNLEIGTNYLGRLRQLFGPFAADSVECLKFTLAAYNAGEGRILTTIQKARELGVDTGRWDSVASVIPEVPGFKGKQTIAYVNNVLDTYNFYRCFYQE